LEEDALEALKILENSKSITWDYDEGADVLYLTIGRPRPAVCMEIGEGIIVRYDDASKAIVGLTLIGLRARLLKELGRRPETPSQPTDPR
jgi:uncharacterized protein YuzE